MKLTTSRLSAVGSQTYKWLCLRRQEYDKQLPVYKCKADRKLAGEMEDSLVTTVLVDYLKLSSRDCTSTAARRNPSHLALLLLSVVPLALLSGLQ